MGKKLYMTALTLMCSLKLKLTRVTREKIVFLYSPIKVFENIANVIFLPASCFITFNLYNNDDQIIMIHVSLVFFFFPPLQVPQRGQNSLGPSLGIM